MNKNRYQVTQDPTETDADFIKRIDSLEKMAFFEKIPRRSPENCPERLA
jgi:hypothetical protein